MSRWAHRLWNEDGVLPTLEPIQRGEAGNSGRGQALSVQRDLKAEHRSFLCSSGDAMTTRIASRCRESVRGEGRGLALDTKVA